METAIGIDLGGTRVKAAAVDEEGRFSGQFNEPIASSEDYFAILEQLENIVQGLLRDLPKPPQGIGLAVAGLMGPERRMVLTSPNIPALNGRSLSADLAERMALNVEMENDANVMALAEGAYGAARGSSHYIAITLGTGVGGAVITEGRLLRGHSGGGGEVGHIPLNFEGPRCGCGNRGCLEAYIGQAGIRRFIQERHSHLLDVGMKTIQEQAESGDPACCEIYRYIGRTLAAGLAGLVNLFNPDIIIIGGGISAAGGLLLEPAREELQRRAFRDYLTGLQIKIAELGGWSGVVGAGSLVFNAE